MECYIYKTRKKDGLYIYVTKKGDFSAIPEGLLNTVGKPDYVMDLHLSPARKLAREDVAVVMADLQEKGYHIQMPPMSDADSWQ